MRFYIDGKASCGQTVLISDPEARHITKVLRLRATDQIMLFDRMGNEYRGIIIGTNRDGVSVAIKSVQLYAGGHNCPSIVVCQALLKLNAMELVIQKSVELGASRLIPFICRYSVPRWDKSKFIARKCRWNGIVTAALKQSGARPMPVLEDLKTLTEIVTSNYKNYLRIILCERERTRSMRAVLSAAGEISNVILIIGPEGGFSDDEIDCAQRHGFVTVGLGDRILRAETVALTVLSIIQYECNGLG